MTSFDGKIIGYGMSVDGHGDRGMKGVHGQIDQLHNMCAWVKDDVKYTVAERDTAGAACACVHDFTISYL